MTWLFDSCKLTKTYVQESDILRLDIVSETGGVYVDHDIVFEGSIDAVLENGLSLSTITLPSGARVPNNCLIASPPKDPGIQRLRARLAKNIEEDPYGHVLDTTGPLAYRQAIEGLKIAFLGEEMMHEPSSRRQKLSGCPMVHHSLMSWQKIPQWH